MYATTTFRSNLGNSKAERLKKIDSIPSEKHQIDTLKQTLDQ